MEKINNAREKLTKEAQSIGGPLANFIEEHINSKCTNETVAAKVEAKSLKDLIKKIEDEARKNKTGNVGMISDADVIEMTDEFYEISGAASLGSREAGVIDVFDFM